MLGQLGAKYRNEPIIPLYVFGSTDLTMILIDHQGRIHY